jgi:DNA-binding response OmpR family regulator
LILVVEDDLATQKMISHFLENEGYKVVVAADGIDALIKMGESRFDLILSDINIPNLDGFRLLEMVQQKGFTAPVILMTGSADQEDEIKGMELGAALYLKKPIRKELLLLQVRKILQPKKLESKVEATQPLSIL